MYFEKLGLVLFTGIAVQLQHSSICFSETVRKQAWPCCREMEGGICCNQNSGPSGSRQQSDCHAGRRLVTLCAASQRGVHTVVFRPPCIMHSITVDNCLKPDWQPHLLLYCLFPKSIYMSHLNEALPRNQRNAKWLFDCFWKLSVMFDIVISCKHPMSELLCVHLSLAHCL